MRRIVVTTILNGVLLWLAGSVRATTYYLATNGNDTASGTTTNTPFRTPERAVTAVNAGDTLYVFGGTYLLTNQVKTAKAGTAVNYCNMWAYPGEHPYFNATNLPAGSNRGIYISKDFWHVKGIEVAFAPDNGIIVTSGSNIIEGCVIHDNKNDGLTIGSTTVQGHHNLILNCDSYRNYDGGDGNDGDGYSAKAGCGPGNIFVGCRSYLNSDDGWDFYDNNSNTVVLSNCWSFMNGSNQWNASPFNGNGNGFKLGGSGTQARHTLMQCVAFDNIAKGFDYNLSVAGHTMYNCTSFGNGKPNYEFPTTPSNGTHTFKNNISYLGTVDIASGIQVSNSWQNGLTVSAADFVSLDPALAFAPRNADYSLPTNGFARLAAGSDLIDAGVDVGLPYNGSAPDLGAYEFAPTSSTAPGANFTASPTNGVAPLVVTFTDISTGTPPLSLSWNLGDSFTTNTAGGASFVHSYAAGTYAVTLIASNSAGTSTLVSNNLIVAVSPQNIWISDLQSSSAGFSFTVNGLTHHGPVIIQASDDLNGWTPQYTNPAVTGTLPYIDSSATNSPNRFYRAEEQ